MRNRFRYHAPSPFNLVTYGLALAVALPAIEQWGAPAWAAVIAAVGPEAAFIGGGFAWYFLWFWAVSGVYLAADRFGWWRRWRIQERAPGQPRRGPPLGKAVRVVLRNQLLGTLPALVVLYGALVLRGAPLAGPPDGWTTILWQLAVIVLVEEVGFYAVHRTLHRKALFRRFHRIHHEFRESIGIATHYVHYAEHLVGNLLPVFAGVLLVGAHPVTTLIWVTLAVTNAIHTHAGYALPWMSWGVDHDFHHYNVNGCYGAMGLVDRALGTDAELRAVAREQAG